jgi:hypothetical protein
MVKRLEPEAAVGQQLAVRHHQNHLGEVRSQVTVQAMKDMGREQAMLQTQMPQPCDERSVRGQQHCQRQVLQRGKFCVLVERIESARSQ